MSSAIASSTSIIKPTVGFHAVSGAPIDGQGGWTLRETSGIRASAALSRRP